VKIPLLAAASQAVSWGCMTEKEERRVSLGAAKILVCFALVHYNFPVQFAATVTRERFPFLRDHPLVTLAG
jgi:hypothetical protein